MPKRSVDWNLTLSKKLKDLDFAKGFLVALVDEGESLQEALGKTIRAYGVKEFAKLTDLEASAIQRAIDPDHNPTRATLEKLLDPFGLVLGLKDPTSGAA